MTPVAAIAAELGLKDPVIKPLHGGQLNRSWRLRDARQDLALRLSGGGSGLLGANARTELAMQEIAAAAGLAPHIVLARPAAGLLVTRFVDGQVLSRDAVRRSEMLARIGAWFARLHALTPPQGLAGVDFGARAAGYLESLRRQLPEELLQDLANGLVRKRKSVPPPSRLVACHHDLHHLNVVDQGDALIALDWEYAGPGDPAADLAACICYHDLDTGQTDALLAGYGGESRALRSRLAPMSWIFDCLWLCWLEIAAHQGIVMDTGRRQCLIERLSS
jgi:thiamine kinase-like enzyme